MAEVEIAMPKLSDSMEQATVLSWLKRPGDEVRRGEPLVEVETDKATVVYEAEQEGVLGDIVIDDGGTAELGAVIARLIVQAEPVSQPPASPSAQPAPAAPEDEPNSPPPTWGSDDDEGTRSRVETGRARATPVARRLAKQLGVSLFALEGSGPGGRIVRADVRNAAGPGTAHVMQGRGRVEEVALTPTQRTIAERMALSRSSIPDFTAESEVSMEAVRRLREDLRFGQVEPLPSYNDFVVRAVALALRDHPRLNASYDDGRALVYARINIGIAVALDDALIVPTVYDADRKTLIEIASESRRLAERARSRALTMDELGNGTFTITNLGMFGVRRFNAVINHPQAAILAVGEVGERPVVTAGQLTVDTRIELALSCDHRIVYGADAARFLQRLRELLEHPALLIGQTSGSRSD